MYPTVQYENNILLLDQIRKYIGWSRGTNADCRLVTFIRYIIQFCSIVFSMTILTS